MGLLVSQTSKRFEEDWGVDTGILQADTLPRVNDKVIITTMQSARDEAKIKKWAKKVSGFSSSIERLNVELIIIDETHFLGCDSYDKILEMFPNATVIGFTATPFRQNQLMTNMFETVAYTISMEELIDRGYLVRPELVKLDFDTTEIGDVASKIAGIYQNYHKGEKCVAYLKTIEDCNLVRQILVANGIPARAVTSELVGDDRNELLQKYKSGEAEDILLTVDVLTAGFDSPNVMAIIMPYKVSSVVTYLQRVGRGLRPYKDKKSCKIYVGSRWPNYKDGYWEKMTSDAMKAGGKKFDNHQDIVDYGELACTQEEYVWSMEVVKASEHVRKFNMDSIADMILRVDFPKKLLQALVDYDATPANKNQLGKITKAQKKTLEDMGLYKEGMSKHEASVLLDLNSIANGREVDARLIVPIGLHKGKRFDRVPSMYWRIIASKQPNGELYKAYKQYKEYIGGNK